MSNGSLPRKPQVNFQLEPAEMAQLEAICAAENINSPAALAKIWVKKNLKQHDGIPALLEVICEARAAGVDVVAVLAQARSATRPTKARKDRK